MRPAFVGLLFFWKDRWWSSLPDTIPLAQLLNGLEQSSLSIAHPSKRCFRYEIILLAIVLRILIFSIFLGLQSWALSYISIITRFPFKSHSSVIWVSRTIAHLLFRHKRVVLRPFCFAILYLFSLVSFNLRRLDHASVYFWCFLLVRRKS